MKPWKQQPQLRQEMRTLFRILRHPRTPWPGKLVAACSFGYIFSPIQLIPNFIPVVGFADDIVVLILGLKLLRRITPADVLLECSDAVKSHALVPH